MRLVAVSVESILGFLYMLLSKVSPSMTGLYIYIYKQKSNVFEISRHYKCHPAGGCNRRIPIWRGKE